jgi:elongation factor Tu
LQPESATPKSELPQRVRPTLLAREHVVFVNTVDLVDDRDLIDLVDVESRELLIRNRYDGSAASFVPRRRRNAVELAPRTA